jgi:hypothetical protein
MRSNKNDYKNLVGKNITLPDGRTGVVTHAGYGMVSVDLDVEGHWVCGPAWYFGLEK